MFAYFNKEVLEGIYGYRFVLSLVLAVLVIPFSLYLGAQRYKLEASEYRQSTERAWNEVRNQSPKPPHSAAHTGVSIWKPPTPMVAFSSGALNVLGVSTQVDPHLTPRLTGSMSERTPLLSLFGKLDYAFVILVIFGLFAFVLSFDLVSGEREDGTLKLILSNSVPRSQVILGKALGGSVALIVPVALATLLSLLFFTPLGNVELTNSQWLQVVGVLVLSALYLEMMFLIGLLVSCLTRRRISSMIVLLIVWVFLVFIIPRSATSVAQFLQTTPSSEEVAVRLREARTEGMAKYQRVLDEWGVQNPGLTFRDVPPSVQVAARRTMDEWNETQEFLIRQSVDAALLRQVTLATNLARLSPSTSYLLSVTRLTGTGVARHQRFLRHLNEYRRRFADHFDRMEDADVTRVEDFEDVPRFDYVEQPLREVLPAVLADVAVMAVMSLLVFAAAFAAFVRYDVR